MRKKMPELERNIVTIMQIGIDSTSVVKVLEKIELLLKNQTHGFTIYTPNPEAMVLSLKDIEFKRALSRAEMLLPDGIGLVAAIRYLSLPVPRSAILRSFVLVVEGVMVGFSVIFWRDWLFQASSVVPGRVIFQKIMDTSHKNKKKIFLLGGRSGLAEELAERYQKKGSNIIGMSDIEINDDGRPTSATGISKEKDVIRIINNFKPDFLFVAFGMPKQEKWIDRNRARLNVKITMGVGGSFDYISTKTPLPPKIFENFGFEWLWRLIRQPWRFFRILRAVIIFPTIVFFNRLFHS